MRILHVAESVKGGCGTYLNQVVRTQLTDPAIHDVHAVLPDAHIIQVPDIPEPNRTLFASHGRSPTSLAALWRATAKAIDSFAPDCVHLHSTFAGAIVRLGLALGLRRPPIVYCAHGWSFDMAGSPAKRAMMTWAERALSLGCEGVVAISEYERARGIAAGIAAERIVTVLNGLEDVAPSLPAQPGSIRRVLFIGRLDRQKGVDVLLRAIEGLEDRIDLRIVGAPVVGDQAPVALERTGVRVLGWCNQAEIHQELAWADCVVIPSRWEGFGLVAVEAMRASRAVIASHVGGLPEVIEDGSTGWLVPPGDAGALRSTLLSLTNAQLIAAGTAGRQRFLEQFTIERTTNALTAVYRQAIAMRGSISHALVEGLPA